MSIIRPIEMPYPAPFSSVAFQLTPVQQVTPTGVGGSPGFLQTIDRASPMWVAKYQTAPMSPLKMQSFMSWLDQLEGANNTFLATPSRYPVPYAFMSQMPGALTNFPWGPGGLVTGINYADSTYQLNSVPQGTLNLAGLTAGTVLAPNDYISYQNGNMWQLYRVVDWCTVSGTEANQAWTLTDSSASAAQYIYQTTAVPSDYATYTVQFFVFATTGGTSPTFAASLSLTGGSGGSNTSFGIALNTDTGAFIGSAGTATCTPIGSNYWLIKMKVTNNGTYTGLNITLWPAYAPHGSATATPSTTGSAIVWGVQCDPGSIIAQSCSLNVSPWVSTLSSIAQNAAGPGNTATVAVKPRPNDSITAGAYPKIRLARPCCAMKIIGNPQWTDQVDSMPQCTFSAAQYIELGS